MNEFFEWTQKFYNLPGKLVMNHTSEKIQEQVYKYFVKKITKRVEWFQTLNDLSMHLRNQNDDATIEWLKKFY